MKKLILMWALLLTTIVSFALPDGRYFYCIQSNGDFFLKLTYNIEGDVVGSSVGFDSSVTGGYGTFWVYGVKQEPSTEIPGSISREEVLKDIRGFPGNGSPKEVPEFDPSLPWTDFVYYFSQPEISS